MGYKFFNMDNLTGKEALEQLDFSGEFDDAELKLIQAIRLGDLEKDPGLNKRYLDWLDRAMVVAAGDKYAIGQVTLLLRKAKLLFQAGRFNEAFSEAMDARTYAENMSSKLGESAARVIDEANGILLFVVEHAPK